ncbi:MAG: hypothetical protein QGG40_21725, partial [Myxococcota bacterium]|nr:hypothetical protein [Myxococcota bacterium]
MKRRVSTDLGTLAVVALVLVPMLGLATAVLQRPGDPITGTRPSLGELIGTSGAAQLLLNSVALSVIVAIGALLVGGWLAWVEHRTMFPGHRVVTLAALLPLAMPSYVLAGTIRSALGPGGWIGRHLGMPHLTGFAVAAVVLVIVTAPLVQLIVGASLSRSSAAEEEAARTLGASPARVFWSVI